MRGIARTIAGAFLIVVAALFLVWSLATLSQIFLDGEPDAIVYLIIGGGYLAVAIVCARLGLPLIRRRD